MKLKVGQSWKSDRGPCKGSTYKITEITPTEVEYVSSFSGITYRCPRKHAEKMIENANTYWNDTNKAYKRRKEQLNGN